MSNASSTPTVADRMITTSVSYNCPCCDAAIPLEAVDIEYAEQGKQRSVVAVCEGCRKAFSGTFKLFMGNWTVDGQVEELTGTNLKGALARIDKLRGDTQLRPHRGGNPHRDGVRRLMKSAC